MSCSNVNVTCSVWAPTSDQFSTIVFDCWGAGGAVLLAVPVVLTVALLIIFVEEAYFIMLKSNSHEIKTSLLWILGSYPAVSVMGTIAVFMPRSVIYLSFIYDVFVTYSIYKLYFLIITFAGGTRSFVEKTHDVLIPLSVTPCCCLMCLKPITSSTKSTSIAKGMIFQNVALTIILGIIYVVLKSDWKLYNSNGLSASVYLSIFNGLSTLIGMYGFNLIRNAAKHIPDMEKSHAIRGKTACMQLLMVVTGFEAVIFNIMAQFDVFPCVPPLNFASRRRVIYNYTVIIQVFMLGILARFYYRRTQDVLRQEALVNDVSTDSVEIETIRTNDGISIGHSGHVNYETENQDPNFVKNFSQSTIAP